MKCYILKVNTFYRIYILKMYTIVINVEYLIQV